MLDFLFESLYNEVKTGQKGKDAMKWMIASDLHGSAYYCKKMVEAFEREGADRLLMLGDLLYHGPRNDLPRDYAPKEVIPMLNGLKNTMLGKQDTATFTVTAPDFPALAPGDTVYFKYMPIGTSLYSSYSMTWKLEKELDITTGSGT